MTEEFITYPQFGGGVPAYTTFASLPPNAPDGQLAITLDTYTLYAFDANTSMWLALATPSSSLSIGPIDSVPPSVNGAVLSSGSLILQSASSIYPGLVNTAAQTFAGVKTFQNSISASNLSGTNTGDVSLTALGSSPNADGASLTGQVLTLQPADGTHPGLLSATTQSIGGDKTFIGAISASNLSGTNSGDVSLGTANGLSLVGQTLSLGLADATHTGALSSTDWNNFNNAQPAGDYITGLTGDLIAYGPGIAGALVNKIQGTLVFGTTGTGNVVFSDSPTLTGTLSGGSGTFSGSLGASNLSGTNTGDQTITLTGQVTGSGTGSFATTIATHTVSNSNLATMPAQTLKGNATLLGSVDVQDLSVSQVQYMLAIPTSSSPLPLAAGGTGNNYGSVSALFAALSPLTTKGDILGFSSTDARLPVGSDGQFLVADSTQTLGIKWASVSAGVTTVGTIDSQTKSANGLVILGTNIYAQTADGSNPGMLSTGIQTIAGDKTFTGNISASNLGGTNSGDVTLGTVGSSPNGNAASLSTQILTLQPASSGFPGVVTAGTQTFGGNKTFGGTVAITGLTANTALIANGSKQIASSTVTDTELGYVSGVTSNIQNQINTLSSGTYKVNLFTLSSTDITNGYVTLSTAPITAANTILTVIGGPMQDYSIDYTVSGTQLSWSGLGLDGILTAGDKLVVQFE
jgi:hypothetical protein